MKKTFILLFLAMFAFSASICIAAEDKLADAGLVKEYTKLDNGIYKVTINLGTARGFRSNKTDVFYFDSNDKKANKCKKLSETKDFIAFNKEKAIKRNISANKINWLVECWEVDPWIEDVNDFRIEDGDIPSNAVLTNGNTSQGNSFQAPLQFDIKSIKRINDLNIVKFRNK